MRIIAGTLRGRRLNPPTSLPVRPTTDMARESLFNILNNYVDYEECAVCDLFAGTGAVSVEFISRGAAEVVAVDNNSQCIDFIRSTADRLNLANLRPLRVDAFDYIKRSPRQFDILFADPPYALETLPQLPDLVFAGTILAEGGIFVLEHSAQHQFDQHPNFWQHRHYGKVNFTFFVRQ